MTETDFYTFRALDLLEAAFEGDSDKFVSLMPGDLDSTEMLLVAMAEQSQKLLESLAPPLGDKPRTGEDMALWLSLIVNVRCIEAYGPNAFRDALAARSEPNSRSK